MQYPPPQTFHRDYLKFIILNHVCNELLSHFNPVTILYPSQYVPDKKPIKRYVFYEKCM